MGTWVISFAGLAALYAALLSLVLLGLCQMSARTRGWRMLPVLFITTFFVFLTQHPFPDPQTLVCPVPLTDPQWQPFHFAKRIQTLMQAGAGPLQFLTNKGLAATAMNFLICFAIGAALARHAPSMRHAMLFAAALTFGVELTQMTGFWGVYPCAYRQFDVDDLMLNFAGVVMGTALGLAYRRLR